MPPWALLGEYDNGSAQGRGRTEYIWLPLEDGSAIPVGFYRNGKLYAVHTDHLGTPRLVTDDEKRPVWQWPYSAFGNNKPTGPLVQRPSAANEPPQLKATEPIEFGLRFPGQQEDAEAGLSNNLFRWYQSGNGRYTQPDRIGLLGGLNRFAYALDNPLSLIDPTGQNPLLVGVGIAATCYGIHQFFESSRAALDSGTRYNQMQQDMQAWMKNGMNGDPPYTQQQLDAARRDLIGSAATSTEQGASVIPQPLQRTGSLLKWLTK